MAGRTIDIVAFLPALQELARQRHWQRIGQYAIDLAGIQMLIEPQLPCATVPSTSGREARPSSKKSLASRGLVAWLILHILTAAHAEQQTHDDGPPDVN